MRKLTTAVGPLAGALVLALLVALVAVLAGACAGGSSDDASSETTAAQTSVTLSSIPKTVAPDGSVTLGDLASTGFALVLPSDALPTPADVEATPAAASAAPPMTGADVLGDGYQVDTKGAGRLDSAATLTYRYDPATTPDPSLLALGYYDGSAWTYVLATSFAPETQTVTFPLYHFSAYYPAQFKNELEAAKHFAGQMAAQKVLGENGGDPKVASRMLADLIADKLGLGEDEFAKRMFADIAADQDMIKMFDQYMREGWTDKGYSKVMSQMCKKAATELERLKGDLTGTEENLKNMRDILKVGNAGSKILGFLAEGDTDAAGQELFDLVTDYTGVPGKVVKYTLMGMQNALDVWRDSEVEKAFQVYTQGSSGTLFGYGAIDPGDFDAVWDNMKGASRQLCVERIRKENQARELLGLPPLTSKEEDFYREKVKQELRSEFERRTALKERVEAQKKNLELIFTELDAAKLFESTNVWIRKIDPNETLESRLNRFNKLIERIFRDLGIDTVYSGPQLGPVADGRISAAEMAVMVRGYFAANTQAEGEKFLQDYYTRLLPPRQGDVTFANGAISDPLSKFEAQLFQAFVLRGTVGADGMASGLTASASVTTPDRAAAGQIDGSYDARDNRFTGTCAYLVHGDDYNGPVSLPDTEAEARAWISGNAPRFHRYEFSGTLAGQVDATGTCTFTLEGTLTVTVFNFNHGKDYRPIYSSWVESKETRQVTRTVTFSLTAPWL